MKLTEQQIKLLEQTAQKHLPPENDKLRHAAEQNPNFKELQKGVANQPLVPKNQMKQFVTGMSVLNNAKALNGLFKKANVYDSKKDRHDIVTMLSNGMNLFTKTLANASAAMIVTGGDTAKKKIRDGLKDKKGLKEQAGEKGEDLIKMINKAQGNAAAYLIQNRISPKTVAKAALDRVQDDGTVTEEMLRKTIRERVKKIVKGKK